MRAREVHRLAEPLRETRAARGVLWRCDGCGAVLTVAAALVRHAERRFGGVVLQLCGVARDGSPPEVWCLGCAARALRAGVLVPRAAHVLAWRGAWGRPRPGGLDELVTSLSADEHARAELRAELSVLRWRMHLRERWGAEVERMSPERPELRQVLHEGREVMP